MYLSHVPQAIPMLSEARGPLTTGLRENTPSSLAPVSGLLVGLLTEWAQRELGQVSGFPLAQEGLSVCL